MFNDINNINKQKEYKTLHSYSDVNFYPNAIDVATTPNIKDIIPFINWYDGSCKYSQGLYVCISKGFYCKLPFPDLYSSGNENYKMKSERCKNVTRIACKKKREELSKIFNTDIRNCGFVHKGEKFIKVGTLSRCLIENFGNHNTLLYDIKNIDIKLLINHILF
jgi:hypothetical protein